MVLFFFSLSFVYLLEVSIWRRQVMIINSSSVSINILIDVVVVITFIIIIINISLTSCLMFKRKYEYLVIMCGEQFLPLLPLLLLLLLLMICYLGCF